MNQEEHDALAEMSEEDAREWLKKHYKTEDIWNTKEVQELFEITSFMSPYCICTRKSDGKTGTLIFCHSPRFYFDFKE